MTYQFVKGTHHTKGKGNFLKKTGTLLVRNKGLLKKSFIFT